MMLVLLLLGDRPAWSAELEDRLDALTTGHLGVDDQSLHRLLRRLEGLNLITAELEAVSRTGARRKVFHLTRGGHESLREHLATTMSYLDHPDFVRLRQDCLKGP